MNTKTNNEWEKQYEEMADEVGLNMEQYEIMKEFFVDTLSLKHQRLREKIKERFSNLYERNHEKHKGCNTRSGECACEIPELKEDILKFLEE